MNNHTLEGRSILVAEDNYDVAAFLQADLEFAGAEVVGPVARVDEALDLVMNGGHLDGAILDIILNDQDVYGVADELKLRGVPFVFVTGYGPERIPREYADVPVCQKPTEAQEIAKALFGPN